MGTLIKAELADLAAQINVEHRAADNTARKAIDHAKRCGELLLQAKGKLAHGEFLPWLTSNCEVGERQARNYMRVAKNWGLISKSEVAADLTIDEAARLTSEPSGLDMPRLSESHVLRGYGENDKVALVIPIGGDYFYVGVIDGSTEIVELPRGVAGSVVPLALQQIGFEPTEAWERRPLSGDDLRYIAEMRHHWAEKRRRGDWSMAN